MLAAAEKRNRALCLLACSVAGLGIVANVSRTENKAEIWPGDLFGFYTRGFAEADASLWLLFAVVQAAGISAQATHKPWLAKLTVFGWMVFAVCAFCVDLARLASIEAHAHAMRDTECNACMASDPAAESCFAPEISECMAVRPVPSTVLAYAGGAMSIVLGLAVCFAGATIERSYWRLLKGETLYGELSDGDGLTLLEQRALGGEEFSADRSYVRMQELSPSVQEA
mmetsp:Transcript_26195/g.62535  ORF Transcript_26195/g.62535 Transcript_26195/m.62535 type:complete len:227 (-) Transcript_26195:46-726(-)|eukprot:CAMPEP_0180124926 /NCGR_PEP_ID=MMETSP0986-20121125/4911_1 /TAXON_ID=697907 /ORGANISM="non described non described, Strain CCMP2293" /LENGTH=226 /DNA_ID=CAMNT_0022064297 /DNA_START=174 /DNA_END=854 /DNA_ORIENTATION=-